MDFEKTNCPVVKINGVIERGKQYDLDITLPEDNRNVIYGIVKDCYKDPVCDAVVKLIEVECKMGKDIRKPVSHTFTDENVTVHAIQEKKKNKTNIKNISLISVK